MATIRKRGKVYYFRYIDENGDRQYRRGCVDKRATEDMARAAEIEVARIKAGTVDAFAVHKRRPLGEHAGEYLAFLRSKGGTAKHADLTETRLLAILEECGFKAIGNLDPDKISVWLSGQRATAGMSIATSNHYLQCVRGFSRWLFERERSPRNPLRKLKPLNDAADRRHDRGALSGDDFATLLAATRAAKPFRGLSGYDRTVLYLIASYTGLRAGELAGLTPVAFELNATLPVVRARASTTKDGEEAELPLRDDLVAILRGYLEGRDRLAPVWPGTWHLRAAQMFRNDLKAAGLPYQDERERYRDFHSLRHRFGSELAIANVPPAQAQELMRHSTITLTMDLYTHVQLSDVASAVGKLPALPIDNTATVADAAPIKDQFGTHLAPDASATGRNVPHVCASTSCDPQSSMLSKPLKIRDLDASSRIDSQLDASSGGGTRTPDTRIMIPLAENHNPCDDTDLGPATIPMCPVLAPDSCQNDPELATVVMAWPALPSKLRTRIAAMATAGIRRRSG